MPAKPKPRAKARKSVVIPRKVVVAVETGVKWLDLTFGRKVWLKRMDMTNFDIRDENVCVAGNVFQDAFVDENGFNNTDGWSRFGELMRAIGGDRMGERFGFYSDNPRHMQYLQDLCVRKIKRLKASAKIR